MNYQLQSGEIEMKETKIQEATQRWFRCPWRFVARVIACVMYAALFFIAEQIVEFFGSSDMRQYEDDLKRIPLWNSYELCEESPGSCTMCIRGEVARTDCGDGRGVTSVFVSGIKMIGVDKRYVWGLRYRGLFPPVSHEDSPMEYFFLEEGGEVTYCRAQDDCLRRFGQERYSPLLDVESAWKTYWQHHGRYQGLGWLFRRNMARKRSIDFVLDMLLTVAVLIVAWLRLFRPFGGGGLKFVKVSGFFFAFIWTSMLLAPLSVAGMLLSVLCTLIYACLTPREGLDETGSIRNVVASLIGGASLAVLVLGWTNYFMWGCPML